MHLPDTNIFIGAIQGHESEASYLKSQIEKKNIVISVIAIAEFYAKANPIEKKAFDALLLEFRILPIDEETAKIAGEYRKQFVRKTKQSFLVDCFLAAQAKLHNLTLVTNNRADFPMRDIKVITPR